MDPADAAYATRELIKPKFAIPMHYGVNPLAKGTPEEFMKELGSAADESAADEAGREVEF